MHLKTDHNVQASTVATDLIRSTKLYCVSAHSRRSAVFPLKVECDGNIQIIMEEGQAIVIPTRFVGATFHQKAWWIVEVFANASPSPATARHDRPLYKWTHLESRATGSTLTSASGALKEVMEMTCKGAWRTSTSGKQLSGIFTDHIQSIIIACCRDKLVDRPDLLPLADRAVSVIRRYDQIIPVLLNDPLRRCEPCNIPSVPCENAAKADCQSDEPGPAAKRAKVDDQPDEPGEGAKRAKVDDQPDEPGEGDQRPAAQPTPPLLFLPFPGSGLGILPVASTLFLPVPWTGLNALSTMSQLSHPYIGYSLPSLGRPFVGMQVNASNAGTPVAASTDGS